MAFIRFFFLFFLNLFFTISLGGGIAAWACQDGPCELPECTFKQGAPPDVSNDSGKETENSRRFQVGQEGLASLIQILSVVYEENLF